MLRPARRSAFTLVLGLAAFGFGCAVDQVVSTTRTTTAIERRERGRVALEQARSRPTYDSLVRVRASLGGALTTLGSGLLFCGPLPYASDVRTIGPEGGELRIGPHRLAIPPGAVQSPTVITGEAPVSSAVRVTLSPDGLQFDRPATLTLSYAHCGLLPNVLPPTVVQIDGILGILERLTSTVTSPGEVSAPLEHFSGYAVAW